ncbi:MAG: Inositol-1-monophosphatase [Candidatus Roizmanbacteria bacterium GW2011_GWC2_37_13]|uniref:Inositol-1-monophosphatase n=1 Tax=Candidatus Roizmanbacteria bacterium GW2011_GWC2_37_13 TaxID=1618486 RepID=A0A0G0JAG4_9BACT|nr:MAG: Inositol-1-monophosphatase [Candidatus Roizmanbacteria bacterium GW2011_GWC1_37_12]KKQ25221.1 MAG: Inositol-1-monophosphatase [Candidatus Roizmanbacteria bacterium GW2011_GWC2_37_13]
MDYRDELAFAKTLALKAGEIINKNFLHSKITTKSNLTPVTETDVSISKMVINEVKKHFPDHTVLDEELQNTQVDSEYIWVCDPVDGTVPFSHHVPTSMFSLALCFNERPVVAVTYDPFIKRMFYTKKDDYSYMNDRKISVNKEGFKKGDYIYGFPVRKKDFDLNRFVKLLSDKQINMSLIESIVYETMLLAMGIVKATVTSAAHPWDRAAAIMIIENANGKCTDENGDRMTAFGNPKYFITSNGTVHEEILNTLQKSLIK